MVYVLDVDGQPLMPTTRFGKVRRMLKAKQARVAKKDPFTIQLLYEPKTHVVQESFLNEKENSNIMKARKGFTLIELVIVVAIIGILALMIIPQFNNVTKDAKIKTFENNHKTLISAYGMYLAANNGDAPTKNSDLDVYVDGGVDGMKDNPTGTTYTVKDGVITSIYVDSALGIDLTKTYPQSGGTSTP